MSLFFFQVFHTAVDTYIFFILCKALFWKISTKKYKKPNKKNPNRLKSTSLTHLAFKRLVSDSQLHVGTRFTAALLCRLSGHVGRKTDEKCAPAGTAHHRATQCKGGTDGHYNYILRRCCFTSLCASGDTMAKEWCSSETTTSPHVVTGRAAGREATAETCQALSLSVF